MNPNLLQKFIAIARTISDRRGGPFRLFALLSRRDTPSGWEIVVSAEWADATSNDILSDVAGEIQTRLTTQELLSVARVLVLEPALPAVDELTRAYRVNEGVEAVQEVRIGNAVFDGYIVIARQHSDVESSHRPLTITDPPSNDYKLNFGNAPISRFNASVTHAIVRETK